MSRICKIKQDLQDLQDCQDEEEKRLTCHNRCLFICCDQAIATYRGGVNVPQQLSLHLANLEQDYRIYKIYRIRDFRAPTVDS